MRRARTLLVVAGVTLLARPVVQRAAAEEQGKIGPYTVAEERECRAGPKGMGWAGLGLSEGREIVYVSENGERITVRVLRFKPTPRLFHAVQGDLFLAPKGIVADVEAFGDRFLVVHRDPKRRSVRGIWFNEKNTVVEIEQEGSLHLSLKIVDAYLDRIGSGIRPDGLYGTPDQWRWCELGRRIEEGQAAGGTEQRGQALGRIKALRKKAGWNAPGGYLNGMPAVEPEGGDSEGADKEVEALAAWWQAAETRRQDARGGPSDSAADGRATHDRVSQETVGRIVGNEPDRYDSGSRRARLLWARPIYGVGRRHGQRLDVG